MGVARQASTSLSTLSPGAGRSLEAAYYLCQEGEVVRPGRLAEWLGVSAPSVTQALQRLVRDGYIESRADHVVVFTEKGERAAAEIVRRHRILEVWLTEVLGLDWVSADIEAHRIAYTISDTVLDRLQDSLGHPTTCPHGNTIPGERELHRQLLRLSSLEPNRPARIARISEIAEHESHALLAHLYDNGLVPGTYVVVRSPGGSDSPTEVVVSGRQDVLPAGIATNIWVELTG